MTKKLYAILSVLVIMSVLLSACAPAATPTPAPKPTDAPAAETKPTEAPKPTEPPAAETKPTEAPAPSNPNATKIRWFIGLGAGGNPEEVAKEEAFVKKFNAKYGDKYELVLDVVNNATAYDVLKTQIASGDVPDIVGPAGVRGLWSFEGAWMDLTPYIEKTNLDVSDFDPALLDFYKFGDQGQVGLPFAIFPSAMWYNKDLFDEAGLAYPPHKYGEKYEGKEWNFETLAEIAKTLTVDKTGKDANDPDFDPENISQFGYNVQYTDPRGNWTFFAPDRFVDENGKAVLPDTWKEAAHWYYDAIWKDHFVPTDSYVQSDYLAQGNPFNSGHVAMTPIHTWYTCCAGEVNWDVAAIPSYNGKTTAKMHADTFGILKGAKNPEASFEVLTLMLGEFAPDLVEVYGAFPARKSLQADAISKLKEKFPNVDWQVFIDSIAYADNPNHESGMPNVQKANDRVGTFGTLYTSTPDLDLDKELDKLIADLQTIFDEVK